VNLTEISLLVSRERQLREALEGLLPIACFGADYFETRRDSDNYDIAMTRIKKAQEVLHIHPESWTINQEVDK